MALDMMGKLVKLLLQHLSTGLVIIRAISMRSLRTTMAMIGR